MGAYNYILNNSWELGDSRYSRPPPYIKVYFDEKATYWQSQHWSFLLVWWAMLILTFRVGKTGFITITTITSRFGSSWFFLASKSVNIFITLVCDVTPRSLADETRRFGRTYLFCFLYSSTLYWLEDRVSFLWYSCLTCLLVFYSSALGFLFFFSICVL
jgi:hypothetical protein